MLNRKFAIAMAAAMVLAVLYGCSSDSGIKRDRDEAIDRADTAEMTLAAVRTALGVAADADQAAILAAINEATADKLVMIRSALGLASDADEAAILTAIGGLQTDEGTVAAVRTALGIAADADRAAILAAINSATTDDLVTIRSALGLASDAGPAAIVAAIGELRLEPADLSTLAHEMEVVRAIRAKNADETDRMRPTGTDAGLTGFSDASNGISVNVYSREFSVGDMDNAVPASDAGAPDAGETWAGSAFERTDEADEDAGTNEMTFKAFVYSNIDAPGDEEFTDYYAADGSGPASGPGAAAVASVDSDGVITLNSGAGVAADKALFGGSILPTGTEQTRSFAGDDDAATEDVTENEFAGTFHGVPGTYTCGAAGSTCSVTSDTDGEISAISVGWTFAADEVAEGADPHMVLGVTPDTEYVYFGYWLQVITDSEGTETIGVNGFTGGAGAVVAPSGVEGTASYSGKAGGKYAVKTVTPQNEIATLNTGQFVADVTLEAAFGGNDVAVNDQNKLTGTVDGFVATGDGEIGHWEVELKEIDLTDLSAGGDTTGDGAWSATFYGAGEAATDTPAAVVGAFDAHLSDGHVYGAYGATKVEEE